MLLDDIIKDVALVTVIENNNDNKNSKTLGTQRKYFDESLRCFESWRKFYPKIKIYAICPTKATLSKKEINQLQDLDVIYLEKYFPETEDFKYGFFNVPLVMSWAEDNLKEKIFIHTDLDMILLRKLNDSLFKPVLEKKIICGKYDENARKSQRVDFDTGFTIHLKGLKFYQYFWKKVKNILENKDLPPNILEYDTEEYAMEQIAKEGVFSICPIEKYQLGEGYPSIDTFNDDEVKNVYFWHEHLVNDKKEELIKEKIKYSKRLRNI